MLNQIDFISSISTGMIKRIKNKLGDKNKLLYFPNFTDSHIFEINSCSKIDNPFLEYLDLKKGKKVIMYSGTFNEKISYQTILETIEILKDRKDIFWIFSGEGPREKFFRDQLTGFKNCIITKFQPEDKLPYWINIADIHLIPQKLSVEDLVLPSKLLAILSSKKPIIGFAKEGTDLGNILDIAGIRIGDESALTLSRAIINLINNPDLRTKLGIAGNQYVKLNHDKQIVLKQLLNKINNIYNL